MQAKLLTGLLNKVAYQLVPCSRQTASFVICHPRISNLTSSNYAITKELVTGIMFSEH